MAGCGAEREEGEAASALVEGVDAAEAGLRMSMRGLPTLAMPPTGVYTFTTSPSYLLDISTVALSL